LKYTNYFILQINIPILRLSFVYTCSGASCEIDLAVCNSTGEVLCKNGGECIEGPGVSFTCNCSPGRSFIQYTYLFYLHTLVTPRVLWFAPKWPTRSGALVRRDSRVRVVLRRLGESVDSYNISVFIRLYLI